MPYESVRGDIHERYDSWDFETHKELEGELMEKKEHVGKNDSRIYLIKNLEDNTVYQVWGSSAIDSQMEYVEKGGRIKITYRGFTKSKRTGRMFKDFIVERWVD